MTNACPVCRSPDTTVFQELEGKTYHRCGLCHATFLDKNNFLSGESEREHYLSHENDPDDPRYRQFLSRLFDPLNDRLPAKLQGLDYGCGPGPALARMLEEAGHSMSMFDPFFAPDRSVLKRDYDFITCTETVEHFHNPAREFARFDQMLRPGGWLAIMTSFQTDDVPFEKWRYRLDPTHVVFYRAETFSVVAKRLGWSCEIPTTDVAILQKPVQG